MSDPVNNGKKIYTLLVQYSTLTGQPTGVVKPNLPTDPNYIAPVDDLVFCPINGVPHDIDILVEQVGGFTGFTVALIFGLNEVDTTTTGVWFVPNRTYDGVVFQIPVPPAQQYKLEVHYGNNQVVIINCVSGGNFYIPGPFPVITKLRMFAQVGDFSDDFSNDFSG